MLELSLGGQVGVLQAKKVQKGGSGLGSLQEETRQDGMGWYMACRGRATVGVGLQFWV